MVYIYFLSLIEDQLWLLVKHVIVYKCLQSKQSPPEKMVNGFV